MVVFFVVEFKSEADVISENHALGLSEGLNVFWVEDRHAFTRSTEFTNLSHRGLAGPYKGL